MKHKEFAFKISKGMVNDFYVASNLKPMGINDFDKPTRTIFCEASKLLKSKNKLGEKKYSSFEIESTISKESFLLIDGGWLPAAYPINEYNLIDRNLMSEIKRHITGGDSSFYGWLNLMKDFNKKYSVIFSALEKTFLQVKIASNILLIFLMMRKILQTFSLMKVFFELIRILGIWRLIL